MPITSPLIEHSSHRRLLLKVVTPGLMTSVGRFDDVSGGERRTLQRAPVMSLSRLTPLAGGAVVIGERRARS